MLVVSPPLDECLPERSRSEQKQQRDLFQVGGCDWLVDVFVRLSSRDVMRCGLCCKTSDAIVRNQVAAICKPYSRYGAVHRSSDAWLHTIATSMEISAYMAKMSKVSVSDALHFKSTQDMLSYLTAVDCCRSVLWKDWPHESMRIDRKDDEQLFAHEALFNTMEVGRLFDSSSREHCIRSTSSMQLQWDESIHYPISFSLRLALCRAGEGRFAFFWEVLAGGLSIQDLDLLSVSVSGCVKSVVDDPDNMQPLKVLPFNGYVGQNGIADGLRFIDSNDAAFQAVRENCITENSEFYNALLRGEPMACIACFDAYCMGVKLALTCTTKSLHGV